MAKPKSEIVKAGRKARKKECVRRGLTVTKTAHIKPCDEQRLIDFVENVLGGICPHRRQSDEA